MTMSWRLASRLSVISLALLVVLVIALFSLRNGTGGTATTNPATSRSNLQGTNLGSTPAPDFLLKDQFGNSISLSQFKGEPVVLTFLYTHCPDVCPLTAEIMAAYIIVEIEVTDPGDTRFLAGEQCERFDFLDENEKVTKEGGRPATYESLLLGITKVSLSTDSWISAAARGSRCAAPCAAGGSSGAWLRLSQAARLTPRRKLPRAWP